MDRTFVFKCCENPPENSVSGLIAGAPSIFPGGSLVLSVSAPLGKQIYLARSFEVRDTSRGVVLASVRIGQGELMPLAALGNTLAHTLLGGRLTIGHRSAPSLVAGQSVTVGLRNEGNEPGTFWGELLCEVVDP